MADFLKGDELAQVNALEKSLSYHAAQNLTTGQRYDGSYLVEKYGIAMPPKMNSLNAILGWNSIVVDTLEERLDFTGFDSPGVDLGLNSIYEDNDLRVEQSLVHHDSLLYGTGFAVVGTGYEGEPSPLITVESPNTMTASWDKRLRRCSSAFSSYGDGTAKFYLPNQTLTLFLDNRRWVVLDRDEHALGRLPVVRFDNRLRTNGHGQSEITDAVEYLSDAAARTALRMEITSEFYSAPKEVILGGDRDLLLDADGNPVSALSAYLGRVQQIPWNEDEDSKTNPQVIQLDPADPKPFIDQINLFGTQLASVAGLPVSYLGLVTNMPTSADAIKAGEIRLVKRAERRQAIFSRGWKEVAHLALLIRDGVVPEEFSKVSAQWVDPSTPTRAATTDAVVKLVQSGVIPADSSLVSDELGLTSAQRATLEIERTKARSASMINSIVPNAL